MAEILMGVSACEAQSLVDGPPSVPGEDPGIGGYLTCRDASLLPVGCFQDGPRAL